MVSIDILGLILNAIAVIGFYITLRSLQTSRDDLQKSLAVFFKDYGWSKSISLRVKRINVRERVDTFYRVKRWYPSTDFQGYVEMYLDCEDGEFSRDAWERIVQTANNRVNGQLSGDFHANPNLHFDSAEDIWIEYIGTSTNGEAIVAIKTVDFDLLRFVVDYGLGPAVVRQYYALGKDQNSSEVEFESFEEETEE